MSYASKTKCHCSFKLFVKNWIYSICKGDSLQPKSMKDRSQIVFGNCVVPFRNGNGKKFSSLKVNKNGVSKHKDDIRSCI